MERFSNGAILKWSNSQMEQFSNGAIWGRHPMPYFKIPKTEKYGMRCASVGGGNVDGGGNGDDGGNSDDEDDEGGVSKQALV